jgi:hypothetical protein
MTGNTQVSGAGRRGIRAIWRKLDCLKPSLQKVRTPRPATAPHGGGVLVVDDSGDRKNGVKTAHVGHQYLDRYGKTGNGVVTVTTVWADERVSARPDTVAA